MMLSKLRNKFLILNMTLIMLTLFVTFAVVYFVTRTAIDDDNKNKLNATIAASKPTESGEQNNKIYIVNIDNGLDSFIKNNELVKAFGMPALTLFTDEKGTLLEAQRLFGSAFDISFGTTSVVTLFNPHEDNIPLADVSSIYSQFMEVVLDNRGTTKTAYIENRVWLYSTIDIDGDKTQATFLDITDSANRLHDLMLTFAFVGVIMFISVFFISLLLANRSIKPVKATWDKQRQFVADASHELKTPLSVMTSTYSALQANENETIKSQSEFFGYMKIGMDKMAQLINDLLSLARIENANCDIALAQFDIGIEIEAVTQRFESFIQEKSVTASRSIEPNLVINSDKTLAIQAFEILFDNAAKYVNEGGTIDVSVKHNKYGIICTVGNSGAGIEKDDILKIFDRFFRADRSRSSETGGFGLGLSIAKSIMDKLGGKISATSEHGWTEFTLIWNT